jgi:hypothetical protein
VRMLTALRRFVARRWLILGTPIFLICHTAPLPAHLPNSHPR